MNSGIRWITIYLLFLFSPGSLPGANQQTQADSLRNSLIELRWAEKEVRGVSEFLSGKCFLRRDANEINFKKEAASANVIHLATHALINDRDPLYSKLVFAVPSDTMEDGLLNTYELYNMRLNANLAVLSACNTGVGKYVNGEGIMSLARGFMYAGCPNVVISLWPIDDKATSMILRTFYRGLVDNRNKDDALRQAKLNFLMNADEIKANPFYWAGLILIGDGNPLQFHRKTNEFFIVSLILCTIAFILIVSRKKTSLGAGKIIIPVIMTFIVMSSLGLILENKSIYSQPIQHEVVSDTLAANQFFKKAQKYRKAAKYDSSTQFFNNASIFYQKNENWARYLRCFKFIGDNLLDAARYDDAKEVINNALETGLQKLDPDHPEIIRLYLTMGNYYFYTSEFDSALTFYQKSLALSVNKSGEYRHLLADSYNNVGLIYEMKTNFAEALRYYHLCLNIRTTILDSLNPKMAELFANIGFIKNNTGHYAEGIEYLKKSLHINEKIFGKNHPIVGYDYNNIGSMYEELGIFDEALDYYYKSLNIKLDILGENHPSVAGSYGNIAVIYDYKGDYQKAIDFYQRSLSIITKIFNDSPNERIINNLLNIGTLYLNLNKYSEALYCFNKALSKCNIILGQHSPTFAKIYNNIGEIFLKQGELTKALSYFKKSLEKKLKILDENHPSISVSYENIGGIFLLQKNYKEAHHYFNKCLAIRLHKLGEKHPMTAKIRLLLAELNSNQNEYEQALVYLQQAMISLVADFNEKNYHVNPTLENISEEPLLLEILSAKANTLENYYFNRSKDPDHLETALATYDVASDLIDKMRKGYRNENSQLLLGEKAHRVYKNAIFTAVRMSTIAQNAAFKELAFRFMEKNKASLLQFAILESKAKQFSGIPDSLLNSEKQLKTTCAYYEKKIYDEENQQANGDSLKIRLWRNNLFSSQRAHDDFIDDMERNYPNYYQLKYQTSTVSIQQLQDEIIAEDQAIVEYFIGDSVLFITTVTKTDFNIAEVPIDTLFRQRIEAMRDGLIKRDYTQYTSQAYDLYNILIAPVEAKISDKKLIIITDGILGYIPLETLLTQQPADKESDYRLLSYLIKKYQITYNYSCTLLYENINKVKFDYDRDFLGFAPVTFK